MPASEDQSWLTCPFCGESGFDRIGICIHLDDSHCDQFEEARKERSMAEIDRIEQRLQYLESKVRKHRKDV